MSRQEDVVDMVRLQKLSHKKRNIKGCFTRINNYIASLGGQPPDNIAELKLRQERLIPLLNEFDLVQNEIEYESGCTDELPTSERVAFEDSYFQLLAHVDRLLGVSNPLNQSINNPAILENDEMNNTIRRTIQVRLPQIELPKFNGSYNTWMSFHDTFTSLIHNNMELSVVQKFQYLKSALLEEAANIIDSIDITADNYIIAWRLLNERYHNVRLIVRNHTRDLFEIASVKRGSSQTIRKLIDDFQRHLRCLKVLGQPVDKWDTMLVHLLTTKLDSKTIFEWESHCANNLVDALPTFEFLNTFLVKKCQASEYFDSPQCDTASMNVGPLVPANRMRHRNVLLSAKPGQSCFKCKKSHRLYQCFAFKAMSVNQRLRFVADNCLCKQCLSKHDGIKCSFHPCYKCKQNHHHLLHQDIIISECESGHDAVTVSGNHNVPRITMQSTTQAQVLLSTVVVNVAAQDGCNIKCRALLDSGARSNFMTTEFCNKLALPQCEVNVPIGGINQVELKIKDSCLAVIQSTFTDYGVKLNFLILDNIVQHLPSFSINRAALKLPADIFLADPQFDMPGRIDMLLGAEIFYDTLKKGRIKLGEALPTLQNTEYGWVLSGLVATTVDYRQEHNMRAATFLATNAGLHESLSRFWQLEELNHASKFSASEKYCEDLYRRTTLRDKTGRYSVFLPTGDNVTQLGDSYTSALRRFLHLERRLNKSADIRKQYNEFINEYAELGHMSLCENVDSEHPKFYLPHHSVIKQDSSTTKLRVVFDGSAKTTSGLALNEVLHVGPNIQRDLFEVILRFRRHNVAITADIEKMYRQINVDRAFTNLQCILWRSDTNMPVQTYALNTVTYGTGCAAYLAIKTLKQLARDEMAFSDLARHTVLNDFYVDDLLSGADNIQDAVLLCGELSSLLAKGGFNLRKWYSNDQGLMSKIYNREHQCNLVPLDKGDNLKTLGIFWNTRLDAFQYNVSKIKFYDNYTKRSVLSTVSSIFDPLGLLGPIILRAKVFIQELWISGINWDDPVPPGFLAPWKKYIGRLHVITELSVPRKFGCSENCTYELHGYSDASEMGYGACIYLRSIKSGNCNITLLASRSRVASLKRMTIVRLELCGALLLANLLNKIVTTIDMQFDSIHLYSDSKIVLAWLRTESYQFHTFVANRISEIQHLTNSSHWHHVVSADNPADCLSRGMFPDELLVAHIWWNGPRYLRDASYVADACDGSLSLMPAGSLPELKSRIVFVAACTDVDFLVGYSSFLKLKRVISYMYRFIGKCANRNEVKYSGSITLPELCASERRILLMVQGMEFPQDLHSLKLGHALPRASKLLNLNPFIDSDGIIRVGGRLENANMPFESKHPVLLPANHHITQSIIRELHLIYLHAPPSLLLSIVRGRYWPLNGRNNVRRICRSCVDCFRLKPPIASQIIGNLPPGRIVPSRPFSSSGVDYCSPFSVKPLVRSRSILKAYILVFVCFATRAIHLELAFDLTTSAFFGAFKRFISRRGIPLNIYSDNATNFVGADGILKKFILSSAYHDDMINNLCALNIKWHFIPARSPHMGGLWESSVRSVKYHLKRVLLNTHINYDSFCTLIVEIEGILNSRPLYPLTDDPNDFSILTPNHFLLGDTDSKIELPVGTTKHYQHIQIIKLHFWKRWSLEYLHHLQQRSKWMLKKIILCCLAIWYC